MFFPIVDTCLSCEDIARQSCLRPLRLGEDKKRQKIEERNQRAKI